MNMDDKNPFPMFIDVLHEVQKRFDVEVNAKNEAYSFIIQMGLLDEFSEFSRHYKGVNHHAACVDMLSVQM